MVEPSHHFAESSICNEYVSIKKPFRYWSFFGKGLSTCNMINVLFHWRYCNLEGVDFSMSIWHIKIPVVYRFLKLSKCFMTHCISFLKFFVCQDIFIDFVPFFPSALSQLDLTHNKIESLPDTIGNLRKLEQLYLRHNRIKSVPPLHSCLALKELYLGNNFIKVIKLWYVSQITFMSHVRTDHG